MPSLAGFHHLSLTVTDLARSVEWYRDVLGFSIAAEIEGGTFRRIRLRHPDSGITLTLTRHATGSGDIFDETRTGLDHVAFLVPGSAAVETFKRRFEERGVEHSAIKRQPGDVAMITLRDPDNIQLEIMGLPETGGGPDTRETPSGD